MNLVVWKNYLEGKFFYRSLVLPIKNGVKVASTVASPVVSVAKSAAKAVGPTTKDKKE